MLADIKNLSIFVRQTNKKRNYESNQIRKINRRSLQRLC